MRATNKNSIQYNPATPPTDQEQMQRYLLEELNKVSVAIALLAAGHLDKLSAAPAKPRDGDIAYADGSGWNPGGTGKGLYMFSTAWTLVKTLP